MTSTTSPPSDGNSVPSTSSTRVLERSDWLPESSEPESPSWRTTALGADVEGRSSNASWGAIFVGVVVALAVLLTFSLVAAALGLGIADPTSDDPFDNVGTAVGLWSIVSLALALAAGGFVAGVLAVRAGVMHGLAVWATSTLVLVVAVVFAVSGAIGIAGSVVGSVGSAIGSGRGTLAGVAGDAVGAATDAIGEELGDVDGAALTDDVQQVLADTGVPELQPDYLEAQLEEARSEVGDAAVELVTDPGRYEEIFDELATSLQARVDAITEAVDRDAIATSVASNTDLTEAEAEEAVDNAVAAVESTTELFDNAQAALAEAGEAVSQLIDDARETLDDAVDAVARAALWAFAGLIVGAAIASFAALWGSRLVASRTETGRLRADRTINPP